MISGRRWVQEQERWTTLDLSRCNMTAYGLLTALVMHTGGPSPLTMPVNTSRGPSPLTMPLQQLPLVMTLLNEEVKLHDTRRV